jgi:hypothetical protein
MHEGSARIEQAALGVDLISDRYQDVIITALKESKFRYGLYAQEHIPFILFDFKVIDFAVPVLAIDLGDEAFNTFFDQMDIRFMVSYNLQVKGASQHATTMAPDRSFFEELRQYLSEQRSAYQEPEEAEQMVKRLKGMVSAEYMIRNSAMDTPWPYKSLCRKLMPGRYWFTQKISKNEKKVPH